MQTQVAPSVHKGVLSNPTRKDWLIVTNFFLTFNSEITLETQKSCKDHTESSSLPHIQLSLLLTSYVTTVCDQNKDINISAVLPVTRLHLDFPVSVLESIQDPTLHLVVVSPFLPPSICDNFLVLSFMTLMFFEIY